MFKELPGKRYHHRHYLSDYRIFESTPLTKSASRKTPRAKIEARTRTPYCFAYPVARQIRRDRLFALSLSFIVWLMV
jgi:hypothetical protein